MARRAWLVVALAAGASAALSEEIKELTARIHSLQTQSGQLSSYKGLSLLRSTWPLGARRRDNASESTTIGLYRIIGNPLPPRHDARQLQQNLQYILDNEPELSRAKKIFVLNRLNESLGRDVTAQVARAGYEVLSIPFAETDYRPLQMEDTYGLSPDDWGDLLVPKFSMLNANLYVMNNNGARNTALRHGVQNGWAWTLPFDGNCYFTASQWRAMLYELRKAGRRNVSYVAVPMVRTTVVQNDERSEVLLKKQRERRLLESDKFGALAKDGPIEAPPGLAANAGPGEHQVAFSRNATIRFDPTAPYGHRPKVSLLWKLHVSGAWNSWNHEAVFRSEGPCVYLSKKHKVRPPNVCVRTLPGVDSLAAKSTSSAKAVVYRLPDIFKHSNRDQKKKSKQLQQSGDDYDSRRVRRDLRELAIKLKIREVDNSMSLSTRSSRHFVKPVFFNVYSMETMRRECVVHRLETGGFVNGDASNHHCAQIVALVALAEQHIDDKPMSVVDKGRTASIDASVQHYQSIGPYDWRVNELPLDAEVETVRPLKALESAMRKRPHDLRIGTFDLARRLRDKRYRTEFGDEFVRWENRMRPDSQLWGEGSEAFDRTRSYEMTTNVTLYALAHFYTGDPRFAHKATQIVRSWFLDPRTRMIPTMRYSHFSRPSGTGVGVFQLKDLTYALDAIALIQRSTAWSQSDTARMRAWCADYAADLSNRRERFMKGYHGLWYALQYAAVVRCSNETARPDFEGVVKHADKYIQENHESNSLRSQLVAVYALIMTWRGLQHSGGADAATRISDYLKPIVAKLDAGIAASEDLCDLPVHERKANVHSAIEKVVVNDACNLGPSLAVESFTPLCQWAFDIDPSFALELASCRRLPPWDNVQPVFNSDPAYPEIPTATLAEYHWPPLRPSDAAITDVFFPFQNLLW